MLQQINIAENACARVPAGIWGTVGDFYNDFIFSFLKQRGNIELKCGVAVFPFTRRLAVYPNLGIHIDALEADYPCGGRAGYRKAFSVPARACLVQVFCLVNKPVVGDIDSFPIAFFQTVK